jgi:hypothetical protein
VALGRRRLRRASPGDARQHRPSPAAAATRPTLGGSHLWQWDGAAWREDTALPAAALIAGVACGRDDVLVVGAQGLRLRRPRGGGAWIDERDASVGDLHGAWAGVDGGLLAVGGDYLIAPGPVRRGAAVARGP